MGNGISGSALREAREAGAEAGLLAVATKLLSFDLAVAKDLLSFDPQLVPASQASHRAATSLYEKPDGWSKVLCELPEGAVVTVCGVEDNFLKVMTTDHIVGYISQARREHVIIKTDSN
jgi:uncharacterized protein (DUF362 family)